MNKLNKLYLLLLLAVAFSCDDAYEIDQPGRLVAENAFRTVDDIELGLLGVYNEMDITPEISLAANFTDEIAIGFDSGGQGFALYDFVINAGSAAAESFWVRNFRVNNRATLILEAAANIEQPEDPAEVERLNNILGQLHFIRAYANFEMLLYFSPDPQDDSTLCVPLIDFVAPTTIQPLRNTTGEIWSYVNSDIAQAESLINVQSNTTRVSQDAVTALKARMALTRGNYSQAENLAMSLYNQYGLANQAEYEAMFLDQDNTEIIFKLERTLNDAYDGQGSTGSVFAGGWAGAIFAFVDATLTGSPYFEMDRSVFDALDPADVRYTVNVAPSSVISPDYENDPDPINNDILVIQKYPGSEGQPLMNDLKVFRSSEMLLIAAEARAYQGDFQGVEDLLEDIRTARFGSPQDVEEPASQQEAIGAVLDERKIELVYEGHRYKDLKRSGVAGNRGVERDPIACELQSGACTLDADSFKFTLPIPITEINANPGIAEQQNPGY